MTDVCGAPSTRLFTSWGTVLYVDVGSGELRHGPVDRSPANARFTSDGADGQIIYKIGGSFRPLACGADRCRAIDNIGSGDEPAAPTVFEPVRLREQWIGLKADELFLCAEPDGRVTLSRQACSAWERFRPSEAPDSAQENRQENDFVRRRVIVMRHRGNLANKMFQYMGALTLASRIKDCTVVNVSIPEWGIEIPDDTQLELFFDNVDLWTWDPFRPHVEELCEIANRSQSIRIMMADHLQRMEFLRAPQFYHEVFPKSDVLSHQMMEKELLINIRTGDIIDGIPQHYPLLPISFYEDVVARTGLKPVFVGQLGDSEYVRQLRRRFSGAQFIDSRGARADFDLIRSAKNIVVAVSTFSWLAAWLSQAETIILPLSGFYNPAHHRELDLLPVDDIRYRFFLFPLNYGLPQKEALQHHERMTGYWKEISRSQVSLLKNAAPFLRVPRQNYDSGLPTRVALGSGITFDPVWYAHRYLDAAMEISEGWFEDPLHHYLEVGKLRGYLPTCPVQDEVSVDLSLPNLALNKRATQSSLSQWSKGTTEGEDAGNAVNGNPSEDGFHTNNDPNPWWMVDLGSTAQLHFIRIFNRERIPEWIQQRANPLVVESSNDGEQWDTLFRTNRGQVFGGYSGGHPLVWSAKHPVEARFVRISIPRREYLHLAEVEVYGRCLGERTQSTDASEVRANPTAETALPQRLNTALREKKPATRVLFFTGTGWAFGSVHFELVKYLHSRGLVGDVLDFGRGYNREEMAMMGEYYDCIVGIVGETWPLTDNYGIPHEKIVVVAHGEYDLQHALETRPPEEFDRFAGYGVISEWLLQLSADLGIRRVPKIVKYGVNYQRFFTPVSAELRVVGYGGSMHREDREGIDWKRGVLAREATEAAGLVFTPAGQFHFLAMPRYYQQVDAVLVTSLREGFGLPAMEAAAAGRLVISTPVGGFPYLASLGAGITAPLDADGYKDFVIEKLRYYKGHVAEYVEMCENIQSAAASADWELVIDDWIALFSRA